MRRLFPLLLVLALSSTAVAGKKKPKKGSDSGDTSSMPTKFVEIDLSEEEEMFNWMIGSELTAAVAPCGNLVKLEPAAIMGQLKDGEIRCLDNTLRDSDVQTVKKKISIVLMKDAWAKSDMHRWEGVARRHLSEIDQSDPALCYLFARYLSKKGPDYMQEAINWADRALDNRAVWVGDEHVERVYNLMRMKAYAANKEWKWLSQRYANEGTLQIAEEQGRARNLTKTMAREWLDFARNAKRPTEDAFELCVSAAGTDGFCADDAAVDTP